MSSSASSSKDPVYDVIAAFAAGLVERGVTDVVISPGSRSTPLSITLHAQPGLTTWIQLDERSAGFFALGQAKATGRPSVLVCTSGTAAANYLPAVVEAHHAGVPLIVCTADRPPELRDWGAGQTIDQVDIYGSATRWAVDLPVAGEWSPEQAQIAAHRVVDIAIASAAGPVHLNWPLREPLEPVADIPVVDTQPVSPPAITVSLEPIEIPSRGVIVVGPDAAPGIAAQRRIAEAAHAASTRTGFPVIGEPISGVRSSGDNVGGTMITTADHLLKVPAIAEELAPDVVVRIGGSPTTKPVRLWMEHHRPHTVLVDPGRRWNDASFTTQTHLAADPIAVLDALTTTPNPEWTARWAALELAACRAIGEELSHGNLLSPLVTSVLADSAPAGSVVMTSNSMPVRDLDSFALGPVTGVDFVGNRGASGIDGITSTALGLASRHDGPVVMYTGDLALLPDLGALYSAVRTGLQLTVVCVDNDGGGIFAMLPIASRGDEVDFETLFRTRHGLDLAALGGTGGVTVTEVATAAALQEAIVSSTQVDAGADVSTQVDGSLDLLLVRVDRDADIAQRRAVTDAVRAAVT